MSSSPPPPPDEVLWTLIVPRQRLLDSGWLEMETQIKIDKDSVLGNNASLENVIRRKRIRRKRWRRRHHFFFSVSFPFLIYSFFFWLSVFFIFFLKTQCSLARVVQQLLCYSSVILVSEYVSYPFPPNLQNILLPKPLELET